jgi:hypothetical protein
MHAYRPPEILAPDLFQNGKSPQMPLSVFWWSQILELSLYVGHCHRLSPRSDIAGYRCAQHRAKKQPPRLRVDHHA